MLLRAFVLHTRPYRDTSLLIDFFTLDRGRVSAVAKGAKRPKSPWRGILQPFTPLIIQTVGKHELQTLTHCEASSHAYGLTQKQLYSGLYMNELLTRLLQREDPHEILFHHYEQALHALSQDEILEVVLRQFEWRLLHALGYGLPVEAIVPEHYYLFTIQQGFQKLVESHYHGQVFKGEDLLAVASQAFQDPNTRRIAKHLMRVVLGELLGHKPIKSRELFA